MRRSSDLHLEVKIKFLCVLDLRNFMRHHQSLHFLNKAAHNISFNNLPNIPVFQSGGVLCWEIIVHRSSFFAHSPAGSSPSTPLICHRPQLKRPPQLRVLLLSSVRDLVGCKHVMTHIGTFIVCDARARDGDKSITAHVENKGGLV